MKGWTIEKFSNVVVYTKKPKGLKVSYPIPFVAMDLVPLDKMEINSFKLIDKVKSGNYVEDGDILLAKITPSFENGKQGILRIGKKYAYATTEVIPFKGKDNFADTLYLAYHLKKDDLRIELAEKMEGSTGRQRLSKSVLNDLPIPLPPLPEQRKIAHVLSTIQKAIEQQDKLIRTTTELKKALMQKLFTEGTRGESQKENEIGLVPESWETIKIGELGKCVTGTTPKTKVEEYWVNPEYDFIAPADIGNTKYVCNSEKQISEAGLGVSRILPKNSVMCVCIGSSIGKVGLTIKEKSSTNQQINSIICNSDFNPVYIYYLMSQISEYWKSYATFGPVPILNKGRFEQIEIDVTRDMSEQNEIANSISVFDLKIEYHDTKKQTLNALFKTLLHELMTGQRRVHELEFE